MHRGKLCISMACAHRSLPPLREARHSGIVESHFLVEAMNLPSAMAQAKTKLRLFACDDGRIKSVHLPQRLGPHHGNTAAEFRFTDGRIPLDIAHGVIDRCVGKSLSTPP